MGKFDFRTGNLRKLLSAPMYAAGYAATRVIPRDNRRWAFGQATGVGAGALALYDEVRRSAPGMRTVWLVDNQADFDDCRRRGIAVVWKNTVRGFWQTARSRVVVVTHGFGDANRFGVFGAFIVQLWHGTPLKLLHLDSPATMHVTALERFSPVVRLLRESYTRAGKQIGMFVAASDEAASRFKTGFALRDDQVAVTGDPRMDRLCHADSPAVRHDAESRLVDTLGLEAVPRGGFLMYAPTWRDGADNPKTLSGAGRARLESYLARSDTVLIVRSHRLGSDPNFVDEAFEGSRVRFLPETEVKDVIEVLGAVDVLITDYSAVVFDFSATGRPIIFLAPDLEKYSRLRGLYEDYGAFTGGDYATTWDDVVVRLEKLDGAEEERAKARTRGIRSRFQAFDDGGNTRRVVDEIRRRLG
ncbi:CDP-glycerol glycerophosphotransferase family protein [Spelaeicoccus albus]|uniref:CDP-glycerol glycerophosphotransferase n=1 Tax=Spelaeicoccus albus TaxID=1280376 RepID=A0A7Z0AC45_9MICO|nr:CDP-glycerol glycerophosphotransferase family protein [Spelaeicoccus albus]NYI66426.1 CDP-glycerol glycerophosphotransferase [Spelaeicoccus albus]